MSEHRRRLLAVDDPLEPRAARRSDPRAGRPPDTRKALYVRLPAAEYEALARAAFELDARKNDLVAALIAAYVKPLTEEGLAALRHLLEEKL